MKILYLPNQYSQQRQHEKKRWIYPVHLAMEAEWYREQGHEVEWDKLGIWGGYDKIIREPEGLPFLELPPPDRIWTNAFDTRYQQNGNFKYRPGTYIKVANGCWHGRCTFCVENKVKWEVRPVDDVIDEIENCRALDFWEIFDDSGTFPTGDWLEDFCVKMARYDLNKDIVLGCNMRMVDVDYKMMKAAGFRMLLFGLESANQGTLDKINKGTKVEDLKYVIRAAKAGLDCHLAVMFGYPWESDGEALRTLFMVQEMLKQGYVKTAQASFYTPPGGRGNEEHRKYVDRIYDVAWSPKFWLNKLKDIHNMADLRYFWRMIKSGLTRGR